MLRTFFAAAVIAACETGITWEMWGNPIKATAAGFVFWIMTLITIIALVWPDRKGNKNAENY